MHVVGEAGTRPERMMNEFKASASRKLNYLIGERPGRTRWTWNDAGARRAVQSVVDELGEPMALFVADEI